MVNLHERVHPNTIDFMKALKRIRILNRGKLWSNNLRKIIIRHEKEKSIFTIVRGRLQEDEENSGLEKNKF